MSPQTMNAQMVTPYTIPGRQGYAPQGYLDNPLNPQPTTAQPPGGWGATNMSPGAMAVMRAMSGV
jgi:hypothetical protein